MQGIYFILSTEPGVKFKLNFEKGNTSPRADVGVCLDDDRETKKTSFTKSGTKNFAVSPTGYYSFYIKNTSSSTISINGSIVFPA